MTEETPEQKVEAASVDAGERPADKPATQGGRAQYPFPRKTVEDALRVPTAIRTNNGGEPFDPQEIAKALNVGGKTGNFFYLTTASRDYGFTDGTRDSSEISLTALGKQAVYPASDADAYTAKLQAFLNVDKFKGVVEHYKGSKLPADEFVRNVLETKFGLDPRTHDTFLDVFQKNCRYLGIGAEWTPGQQAQATSPTAPATNGVPTRAVTTPAAPAAPNGSGSGKPVCFVAMPFTEKTEAYPPRFFTEVYASLFEPAIEAAGFEAKTAKGQGSDVIHSTIVNGLLDADLALVDLTEHNPNVLFELGLRIAEKKPTVLVKAIGTNPIFDVDNLMRVVSYNPNLWPSTVKEDLPRLTEFIKGAWAMKDTERPYMEILRQQTMSMA
ncbi:hypothetical protein [Tsukamurella sp. PLM1]|uniref:hypothetical protein n=1 Tax=Tsukamurella sp. PLM1 TaxID=2929795 RepID=UPI002070BDE6|nr:hypothetical protein [Tsukamurella sp. PLM1]BDH56173.1 hypothetical protein MTP03_11120 [Tsukamurella sp. PLM1]